MNIRQEILSEIQNFLQKESKQKKDYRNFIGNLKKLKDAPRLQDLTSQELTTCQQVQEFLKQWQENYQTYPKVFTKEQDLTLLSEAFQSWLIQAQNKTEASKPKKPKPQVSLNDWDEKISKAEKGIEWLDWWEKHQTAVKFAATIIGLLFLWLVLEKVKEKLR